MDPMKMHWSHELHQAASNGDPVSLQHLLEQGHSPDTEGGLVCSLRGASELSTRTPLHYSAKRGHLQCLRLLLQYGANPNARDSDGYSPIHYVCQTHSPSADVSKNVRLCLQSLGEFGADTKARTNSGHTPLTLARRHRNMTCVNHLLSQGNDSNSQVKPLLVLSRNAVSALIHAHYLKPAHTLWIPDSLKRFLLFEDIQTKWSQK